MYYTIYKTTNKINGKIYIGQHRTLDLNDRYLGSGTLLKRAIIKHGIRAFHKEVMFVFGTFEEMDDKERELVTPEFIQRSDNYNISVGGNGGVGHSTGNVVARYKDDSVFFTIPTEEFYLNRDLFCTATEGTIYFEKNGTSRRYPVEEYDPTIHKTPSTGKRSVYFPDGSTASIPVEDFDPTIHKSVFGGIIAEIDGVRQYVTRDEFDSKNLVGVHAGKVTARNKLTGEVKHIPADEFHANRDLYDHNTTGYVTGKHKVTGEARRIATSEVDAYRDEYNFSTTGYSTVFDEALGKFTNIPKDQYDPRIHKKANATKFELYNKDNECIMKYWGTKRQFLSENGFPEGLWIAMLEDRVYKAHIPKYQHLDGYYFKRIDWKKSIQSLM